MSSAEGLSFSCEGAFRANPQLYELIWFSASLLEGVDPSDSQYREELDLAEEEVRKRAEELLREHFPDLDPQAPSPETPSLNISSVNLWAGRAMLAATDIHDQFSVLQPGDIR